MLLNLRALAHSNNMTDIEMSRTTLHFAPVKYPGTKPDVTTEVVRTHLGDTSTGISEEERAGVDGSQSANHDATYSVRFHA
jgi:hypothetical protein